MASVGHHSEFESDHCMDSDWSAVLTRVQSFRHFPSEVRQSAERLARAGFYYTGEADRVRCFSCRHTVDNWQQGDEPVQRHHQASPACKFLSCVHGLRPSEQNLGRTLVNGYVDDDEDAEREDMYFRLRSGEVEDQSQYPAVPHMRSEDQRLHSFQDWPASAPVTPRSLAQAGFYYAGQDDMVQCFCCRGRLCQWVEGDVPWDEHDRSFPNCFFILGHDVGNVPSRLPPEAPLARRSNMESYQERLQSFSSVRHPVDPARLATAGFYSQGVGDRVTCFKCGGGLKDWNASEDPWEEHAKQYPGCSFVLEEKGQEFVNSVQLRDPAHKSPTACHYNVLPKSETEHNVLQSSIAQQAVAMNMDPTSVEHTILEKMHKTGQGYSTVEELLDDMLKAEGDTQGTHSCKDEDPLEKLRKLQQEKLCKVCMDNDISIVFIPCGHLVTCGSCSQSLTKCPICCADISQKIKTYCS